MNDKEPDIRGPLHYALQAVPTNIEEPLRTHIVNEVEWAIIHYAYDQERRLRADARQIVANAVHRFAGKLMVALVESKLAYHNEWYQRGLDRALDDVRASVSTVHPVPPPEDIQFMENK